MLIWLILLQTHTIVSKCCCVKLVVMFRAMLFWTLLYSFTLFWSNQAAKSAIMETEQYSCITAGLITCWYSLVSRTPKQPPYMPWMWTTVKSCSPPRPTVAFLHYWEKLSRVQDFFRATDTALKMLLNRTGCYISFRTQLNLISLTGRVRNGFPLPKHFWYTIYMLEWKWAYIQ